MIENSLTTTEQFLAAGGEMGTLIRGFDWAASPLGNPSGWPLSLKTSVAIMLRSGYTIFVWWGPEMIMFYNDAYRQVLGKKHPYALGKPAASIWSEIWSQIGPMMDQVLKEGKQFYAEDLLFLIERKGFIEESYFTFSYSPIPDDAGGIGGIFCACNEETSKVLRQRRLKTLNDIAGATAEIKNVPGIFDACSRILAENPHDIPYSLLYRLEPGAPVARLAGYTGFTDREHMALVKTIPVNGSDVAGWPIKQVLDSGKKILLDDTGSLFDALPSGPWPDTPKKAVIVPIGQPGQDLFGFLISGISPKLQYDDEYRSYFDLIAGQISSAIASVQAFEAERRRAEALAEIDREKTAFFSNISHEFRTPLTLMLGPLEEMLVRYGDDFSDRTRQSLESIHRNAMRLLRLVNTLLDVSRIEAGRIQAQFYAVDICAFTIDIASNFRSIIEKAGIQFIVHCVPTPDPVYVDREMWEKIVLNLLSNAYKYTLSGRVEVNLRQDNNNLLLTVSDTGIGIPEKEIPRMFERFHRVKATTGRTHEGTGIGLSLVSELVKFHKGTIAVQSTEGKGTTFTVSIPVGKEHLPPEQVFTGQEGRYDSLIRNLYLSEVASLSGNESRAAERGPLENINSQRTMGPILVVDDNQDMRMYIRNLLGETYDVDTAVHGNDALEKMRLRRPSLILSDIMMPVMDGIQLLNTVKSNPDTASIPVILLSARAGEEARIEGYNVGADDYLVKPFSAKELLARVQAQLKTARIRATAEAHLRNLLMQAPVAIAIYRGPEFVIELANEKVLEFWGRTAEEVAGKPVFEVLTEIDKDLFYPMLTKVFTTGERFFGPEVPTPMRRNGRLETVYVNFTLEAMRDLEGTIIAVMVVANDVTDLVKARKLAEENAVDLEKRVQQRTSELTRSNLELTKLNAELEQFAYIASHDLQEPLRKIQTFTDLLRDHLRDPDAEHRYLEKIISSSSRMLLLIRSLLNYSKLSRQGMEFESVDLNKVLEDAREDLELMIAEKNALIHNEYLPTIKGIRLQLNQLFNNLLSNSLKFCNGRPEIFITSAPAGAEQLQKYPSLDPDRKYISILFKDNGIGFEAKYAEQVFAIFQRLNRTDYAGTGIGLALCKKIVQNHKGVISVDSEVDKGTTFYILLPVDRPDA